MNETWRECLPNYEVSDMGRVRRSTHGRKTYAGRLMALVLMKIGYLAVRPTIDGKNKHFYVHELVAAVFLGPRPKGATINHIDGIKTNNTPDNLEYVTHAHNMRHARDMGLMVRGESHGGSKLTEAIVRMIRDDRNAGLSYSKLAAKHGISIAHAFNIVHKKTWSHIA